MAITIFSKERGVVSSFPDPTMPASTTLRLEGWQGFSGFKSIITRVNVSAQGNFQFLHTLGGNIYVYVFGDRMGQLGISGLAFDSTCEDPYNTLGIERVLDYYAQNRIANRSTPVKVTIGVKTTLAGYLAAINGDVVDPKSRIYQFNMQFLLAPTSNVACSSITGGSTSSTSSTTSGTTTSGTSSPGTYSDPNSGGIINNGSFTNGSVANLRVASYNTYGTGPNVQMVKAQVR